MLPFLGTGSVQLGSSVTPFLHGAFRFIANPVTLRFQPVDFLWAGTGIHRSLISEISFDRFVEESGTGFVELLVFLLKYRNLFIDRRLLALLGALLQIFTELVADFLTQCGGIEYRLFLGGFDSGLLALLGALLQIFADRIADFLMDIGGIEYRVPFGGFDLGLLALLIALSYLFADPAHFLAYFGFNGVIA